LKGGQNCGSGRGKKKITATRGQTYFAFKIHFPSLGTSSFLLFFLSLAEIFRIVENVE
jgi:hypothetical protein